AGRDVIGLVFDRVGFSGEHLSRIEETLRVVIDEDELNWELNREHFPREVISQTQSGERIIGLNWNPVLDDSGTVTKMMVTLRDLTDQRAWERRAMEERA